MIGIYRHTLCPHMQHRSGYTVCDVSFLFLCPLCFPLRYLSASEATWKLFRFQTTHRHQHNALAWPPSWLRMHRLPGRHIRGAALHIWDMFPMVHRKTCKAVGYCLCNITGSSAACGGGVFIYCGDFRQVSPVIPGGGKLAIVEASIRSCPLWREFALPSRRSIL